uniref:Uncharacterized protein n=1 Tax=Rhizophora mucronata TaxID=61149 RepID=A0A2P2NPN1_RHIMU
MLRVGSAKKRPY